MDVDYPHEGNCLSASVLAFLNPGLQLVIVLVSYTESEPDSRLILFQHFPRKQRRKRSNKVITVHIQTDPTILYDV